MEAGMNEELRDQIYNSMNMKETDELIEIWETNNRYEWTDTAFDVVRQILLNRIGELPEQNDPVFEENGEEDTDNEEDSDEEEVETPKLSELADPDNENLACPRCGSTDLLTGDLNTSNSFTGGQKLFFENQEITGLACQYCGFVFMMLKSHLE
jgi:DNA-directed RNA polymerase subunit RPC12/RpoP